MFADGASANGRGRERQTCHRGNGQALALEVAQQLTGVGVLRRADNVGGVAVLLNLTVAKHQQPVRALRGQGQIVGDKQNGGTRFPAQDIQQVENTFLHRHVQRAGGLVGNDDVRAKGNGDGNQHALLHTAGKLMRILRHALFGVAQADLCQQGKHLLVALGAAYFLVQLNNFPDLHADRLHRVE